MNALSKTEKEKLLCVIGETSLRDVSVEEVGAKAYNLMRMAQTLSTHWGVGLIDGYDGMEGNGPLDGTAVPSRVALASLDHVAADRVGVELMGINPQWMGYLRYSEQMGLGNYDLAKIDVVGEKIDKFKRTYKLPRTIQRQLMWLGPLA